MRCAAVLAHRLARGLLPALLGGAAVCAHAEGAGGVVQDAGVQMRWRYESQGSRDGTGLGRLTLELSDQASGSPLRHQPGQLAVWLQRRRPTLSEGELACLDRVKSLVSTGIGRRADIDLNTYRILTLNADRTLAFINPFVGLNNAKLESIVVLPGEPRAWVHVPERGELWVLVGGAPGHVLAIDTHRRRIARTLALPGGAGGDGATLAVDAGAGRLWLALPSTESVAALELGAPEPGWRSAPASGVLALHALATSDGAVILTTQSDGGLTRWSLEAAAQGPRAQRHWTLPRPVRGVAYSALARRLVAHDSQALLSIDPDGSQVQRVALGHPPHDLALADEGRFAIAVGGGYMSMVDLATGAVRAHSPTVPGARQVLLTRRFAYAIAGDEASASLWSLADLRAGRVQPAQVLLGSAGAPVAVDGLRRAIAAPDGAGVLAVNASDRLVYQYVEGMMAPVGSYSNYKRIPLAIGLLDLAPREVAPGRYEVPLRYDTGGTYHLIVSGAGPRFAGCDRVVLAPTAGQAEREAAPELKAQLLEDRAAGPRRRIVVALSEQPPRGSARALARVPDLTLLLFDRHSGWQRRVHLSEQGDATGRYAAEIAVPQGARYELFVGSVTHDLPYLRGRVADAPELRR